MPTAGRSTRRRGGWAALLVSSVLVLSACSSPSSSPSSANPSGGADGTELAMPPPAPVLPTLTTPPPGFAFQDYLDLRVAVGPAWKVRLPHGQSCSAFEAQGVTPGTDQGGTPGTIDVLALGDDAPVCSQWRSFRVRPSGTEPLPNARYEPVGVDHALRAIRSGDECDSCRLLLRLVDLGVDVEIEHLDAATRWMMELLSASPLHQVVSDGPLADTTGWVPVEGGGLRGIVPPSWLPVRDLSAPGTPVPGCGAVPFFAGPAVLVGWPGPVPATGPPTTGRGSGLCTPVPPAVAGVNDGQRTAPVSDGLWLDRPTGTDDELRSLGEFDRSGNGRMYTVLGPGLGDLVEYWGPGGDPIRSIEVTAFVQVDGRWVQVGLGPDPTIARTVLANLHAT